MMIIEDLSFAVRIGLLFSGVFLWVGMLTGVWKYLEIQKSAQARAHYYVDIAHRSSLLYAPAALILAMLAYFSVWSDQINLICVVLNLCFFSFAILSYVLHGWLQDTHNQFKQPYRLGKSVLPSWLLKSAMWALVLVEVFATAILLLGAGLRLLS